MAISKILYPLDLTGERSSNRISDEHHVIGVERYRAIALNYGPFYPHNLTVRERGSNTTLERGRDYECLYLYPELTKQTGGKEVAGVLLIHNESVGTDIEVSYNIVGSHYGSNVYAIAQAIADLELDNRNVYWKDVLEKPELFQPAPHAHDIGDVYGFEFVISILGAIKDAIMVGDNQINEAIKDSIEQLRINLQAQIDAHNARKDNPHEVDAHQVDAYFQSEVDAFIQRIDSDIADREPLFQAIRDDIVSLGTQFSGLLAAVNALDARVGAAEQSVAQLNLNIGNINISIADINAELLQIDNTLLAHKNRMDDIESDIKANTDLLADHTRDISANAQEIQKVKDSSAPAVGDIKSSMHNEDMNQWLYCNGAQVSRTVYADLFDKIGTTFGAGNGSTTFNLPDFRGVVPRGWDNGRGLDEEASRALGSYQESANKRHKHDLSCDTNNATQASGTAARGGKHGHTQDLFGTANGTNLNIGGANTKQNFGPFSINEGGEHEHSVTVTVPAHTHDVTCADDGGKESRPVNIAINFYIKY